MFLDGNVFPPLIFFIPGLRQSSLLNGQKRETGIWKDKSTSRKTSERQWERKWEREEEICYIVVVVFRQTEWQRQIENNVRTEIQWERQDERHDRQTRKDKN